ncbi:MAG: SRPBCC family protein [Myxococcota bacterium]
MRYILGGVALALLAALGVSASLPSEWRVVSKTDIQAAPPAIHRFVADFEQWGRWAQWREAEAPNVELRASLEDEVPTQRILVDGEERARLTMRSVSELEVVVEIAGGLPGTQTLRLNPAEGGTTEVTWIDEGRIEVPLIAGLFAYDIRSKLEEHHKIALRKLRALAESVR